MLSLKIKGEKTKIPNLPNFNKDAPDDLGQQHAGLQHRYSLTTISGSNQVGTGKDLDLPRPSELTLCSYLLWHSGRFHWRSGGRTEAPAINIY